MGMESNVAPELDLEQGVYFFLACGLFIVFSFFNHFVWPILS
jgi:hypothetical protein